MREKEASSVLLDEKSLLADVQRVRHARGDRTLTKTVRDLLREKLTEIRIKGDPHALHVECLEPTAA